MAIYYDKGTHIELRTGKNVHYIPKNTLIVQKAGTVQHQYKNNGVQPDIVLRPEDVETPFSNSIDELGKQLAVYFFRTSFDNADPDAVVAFDGTDTTVTFDSVTDDVEAIVTVVDGTVTGELTTTMDTVNNEVTVHTSNPDDTGMIHVELVNKIGLF